MRQKSLYFAAAAVLAAMIDTTNASVEFVPNETEEMQETFSLLSSEYMTLRNLQAVEEVETVEDGEEPKEEEVIIVVEEPEAKEEDKTETVSEEPAPEPKPEPTPEPVPAPEEKPVDPFIQIEDKKW